MKKLLSLLLCIIIGAALLAGCASQQGGDEAEQAAARAPLVGEWSQITDDGSPSLPDMGIPSGYRFDSNGKGLDTFWDMTFTYTVDGNQLHISYESSLGEDQDYTFEIKKDVLTMTRKGKDAVPMLYQKVVEESTDNKDTKEGETTTQETTTQN